MHQHQEHSTRADATRPEQGDTAARAMERLALLFERQARNSKSLGYHGEQGAQERAADEARSRSIKYDTLEVLADYHNEEPPV